LEIVVCPFVIWLLYCSGLDGAIPSLLIENDIFSETGNVPGIGWGENKGTSDSLVTND